MDFNAAQTSQDVATTINQAAYPGGGTETQLAIGSGRGLFQNQAREGVAKVMIVITDGQSNSGTGPVSQAAALAQNEGIIIFAIGVGSQVQRSELNAMASAPVSTHVFQTTDFNSMAYILDAIESGSCNAPAYLSPSSPTAVDTLQLNEHTYFNVPLVPGGMDVTLTTMDGAVLAFGSYWFSSPNSAVYDITWSEGTVTVYPQQQQQPSWQEPFPHLDQLDENQNATYVNMSLFYIGIIGSANGNNTFMLSVSLHSSSSSSGHFKTAIIVGLSVLGVMCLCAGVACVVFICGWRERVYHKLSGRSSVTDDIMFEQTSYGTTG